MKAKDLAAMLLQCDPEAHVYFDMISGCCGNFEELELSEVSFMDVSEKEDGHQYTLKVEFHPLPGYESCMQAGKTKESHKKYWEEHNPHILNKIKNRIGI